MQDEAYSLDWIKKLSAYAGLDKTIYYYEAGSHTERKADKEEKKPQSDDQQFEGALDDVKKLKDKELYTPYDEWP